MEAAKKERTAMRSAFTKAHNNYQAKMAGNFSKEEKVVAFQMLEVRMLELDAATAKFNQFLYKTEGTPDDAIARELETDEPYRTAFITARLKMNSMDSTAATTSQPISVMADRKTMKLPIIELPKFSGKIKEWLPFWSQFKKINDDTTISGEDKYQYLMQATVPGSRANDIVNSFPPTRENYQKAVDTLRSRFGRDDLLVEFYVRELLGLVLQNALKGSKRPASLASLYDRLESFIRSLDTLGVTKDKCTAMLFPLVESSLPEETLRAWQRSGQRGSIETDGQGEANDRLTKLLEFLRLEVESEERIDLVLTGFGLSSGSEASKKPKGKVDSKEVPSANVLLVSKSEKKCICIFCKSEHESKNCEVARKLELKERKDVVKKENACFICLMRGHPAKRCRSHVKCDWCSKRHVLLMCSELCREDGSNGRGQESNVNVSVDKLENENSLATLANFPKVCLQTLRVEVYSPSKSKVVRAVIDTASQRSYIRTDVARDLQYVPIDKITVTHSLFGGVKSESTKLNVFSINLRKLDKSYSCNFAVLEQNIICDTISGVKNDAWVEELRKNNITLSDIDSNSDRIDVLIGADVAGKLVTGKKYDVTNGLTAFETLLGWTVMGKLPEKLSEKSRDANSAILITAMFVREAKATDLWELDIIGIKDPIEKLEKAKRDDKVLDFLIKTAKLTQGRYEVNLPWIENNVPVPSNYDLACGRLKNCILKLKKENLFEAYDKVFKEWLAEGIIEEVPENEINDVSHYLPHRPVVKSEGTTKIRPVFDASACAKGCPSLNQCVERGPNLIEQVTSALNRFREGEIGVVSDITKAFLQIGVNRKDRDYLRFLWREGDRQVTFRHCRVVFGLACSPFLLAAILALLMESALKQLEKDPHCKWSKESLEKLKNGFYVLNLENPNRVTKRNILAATHKIYDPLGVTCPVSLLPKVLLRKLWDDKMSWDTEIESGCEEFLRWEKDLPILKQIEIPRRLGRGDLTLHVFGDASGLAYASVVFARVEYEGTINISLINAKSRVAPRNATIPRLELMAATISVRLASSVTQSLTRSVLRTTYWTDSTTVLAWIKRDLQWNTFVYNRVKEIRSSSRREDWRFVPGELNPADLPSRGCFPSKLVESEWWTGPEWLYKTESEWPATNAEVREDEIRCEMKKLPVVQMTNLEKDDFKVEKYFNSYYRLLRFLAWMKRFLNNRRTILGRKKSDKDYSVQYSSETEREALRLAPQEIRAAENSLLLFLQKRMFSGVNGGQLSSFKTFLNEDGIQVLKTKIDNRVDSFQFRCPVLLDGKDEIVRLLVRETHERLGHAGTLMIMNILRERFWITSLRKVIRTILAKCVTCKAHDAKRLECEPPPLPLNRVRDAAVFEVVGVDFAGPLFVRGGGKAWICIFTCAVYRAVHFELATSLSVEGFLECFRRFMARRGRPRDVYSDNGTNFVGTNNAFKQLDWYKISKQSALLKINWHFSPPSAPWWGGWWERLIGITKRILRKILGRACLSYAELYTALCDVEAIINARPLMYVSENPDDLIPLSPSVFLQEVREVGVLDCDMLYHTKLNNKAKYRLNILKELRMRFRTEYLGQLIIKKGKEETREIKIGDIVLIGDDLHRRLDWPLARVVEIYPGRDGKARVALLKTKDGLRKRALQRVYPLEVPQSDAECVRNLDKKTDCIREKEIDVNENNSVPKNKKCEPKNECNKKDVDIVTRSGRRVKRPQYF